MTFQEYFQQVKDRFAGADVSGVASPTRIQIDITGEAAGTISDKDFWKIVEKKLDPVVAFTFGKLKAQGDLGKALELKKLIK